MGFELDLGEIEMRFELGFEYWENGLFSGVLEVF